MNNTTPTKIKMEQKYTKGPWHAVNYCGFINLQRSPYYGSRNLLDEDKIANAKANGQLASASPDLLKAAEMAILELQLLPCKCDPKVIKALEKAINKALTIQPWQQK